MAELLKNLVLDAWYKVFVYIGVIGFAASLFFDVKGITNGQLLLLSIGIFLLGAGEWTFHSEQMAVKEAKAYTGPAAIFSFDIRKLTIFGVVIQFVGLVLVAIFIWTLVKTFIQ